ncbi:MAG: septum formation initiator family protein [Bacteroidales bacterium]|nr:septum formation initiator family protein [Bacteroidales bacterium]
MQQSVDSSDSMRDTFDGVDVTGEGNAEQNAPQPKQVPLWLKVWRVVKNRYVATILIFLILWLGVSKNNLFVSLRLHKQVKELETTEKLLKEEMYRDSVESELLRHNKEALERYGREHYYMRGEKEDVFVVVEE